jgi:hypothetical protein
MRPTRFLRNATLAAAAGVLLPLLSPAHAADRTQPFKAIVSISEVLGLPTQACYATAPQGGSAASGTISGQGLGTPLGSFTLNSVDCITSASPPPNLLPPLTFSSKQVVIRTTAGDQIVAEYEGTATATPTGQVVLSGSFTFVSGTGRYQGVKGQGLLEGLEDIANQPAKGFVLLTGRISR